MTACWWPWAACRTPRISAWKTPRYPVDEKGFIKVNENQQTSDPAIYAIGDIAGGVLLAHKASAKGASRSKRLPANPAASATFTVPAVVFTDPEVAWCGLTEAEAKAKGLEVEVAKFPWGASGRALTFDRPDGLTKLIMDPRHGARVWAWASSGMAQAN